MNKLRLVIVDTPKKFEVRVMDGKKIVNRLDWHGGHSNMHTDPLEYKGRMYVVFGPFHSFQGIDKFRLFEMTEVAVDE